MLLLLGFAFLAGIFTALSPCILPVLPAILASGIAKGRMRPLGTILGLICSFSFFTLTLSWLVHATGISPSILRYVAIALIFFFGLILFLPKFSDWFAKVTSPLANLGEKIQGTKERHGFLGGFVFGVALGLIWTPCAGPILGAITTLAATRSLNITAVLMTFAYSIGTGLPMFLYAYGSSKILASSRLLSRYTEKIRRIFGLLMILFATVLFFNWDIMINQRLAKTFPTLLSEKNLSLDSSLESLHKRGNLSDKGKAPEITGITEWINSPPLSLTELRGRVVLLDFWTYSCINCIRTIPHLNTWYHDYKDYGFVIVGIHTPEFEFEKNLDNVQKAVDGFHIEYPVGLDNHYATWNAYHNSYWPAHYLIDQNGNIQKTQIGEGGYAEMESAIRELLNLPPLGIKDTPGEDKSLSPETYLGLGRGHSYVMNLTPNETVNYQYKNVLGHDQVGLKGPWKAEQEYIEAEGDDCYINMNFLASQVYLVLEGSSPELLAVILDDKSYGFMRVDGAKKYTIVKTSYGRHTLSIKVPRSIKAYAFTFGGN